MNLFGEEKHKELARELRKAAAYGDRSKVLELITNGADVNDTSVGYGIFYEMSPMMVVADMRYFVNAVRGASVYNEHRAPVGFSPLHWASLNGHAATVEALLANGSDVKARDDHGTTPLYWASYYGYTAVAQLLLSNGADVNVKDNSGKTPRDVAVSRGHDDVVKVLDNAGTFHNPNTNGSSSIVPADARVATAFYREVMTLDRPGGDDLNERLGQLVALVEDLHMLKLLYTAVASLRRADALSEKQVAAHVFNGLSRSSELCVCRDSVAIYKLVLMKAAEDGYLSEFDRLRFDNDAEVVRMANAPFVKDIVESVRANTARIEGLEANMESINASLNKMRMGMKRKLKVEGVVGMFGATLNVITLGAAGGFFTAGVAAFFEAAVDFGDAVHLKSVAANLDARFPDEQLMEKIQNGMEIGEEALKSVAADLDACFSDEQLMEKIDNGVVIGKGASGMYANSLLANAVKEGNVLVVVSANAAMQQQSSNQAMPAEAGEETSEAAIGNSTETGIEEVDANPTDHHQYLSAEESHEQVKEWLLNYLPRLRKEDMARYREGLIDKGFDSNEMLSLEIKEGDLEFMKDAHKRALLKKLSQERDG